MNLTTEPWIPAIRLDGTHDLFSLQSLFAEAHRLRDLRAKPHERIALMRLLLCITQAALDGPADEDDWAECLPRIQACVPAYLQRWQAAFELLGDGPRFLQASNFTADKKSGDSTRTTKLDFALATGNNATLFDNYGSDARSAPPGKLALDLLTFLAFTPSEIVGEGKWFGVTIPKTTGKQGAAGASSALHTFVLGDTLVETIWANLFDRRMAKDIYGASGWGHPIWEDVPTPANQALFRKALQNATSTLLGRLVPVSRLVRLAEDGISVSISNVPLGWEYTTFDDPKVRRVVVFREPHSTVRLDEDGSFNVLRAEMGRCFWRDLTAILTKQDASRSSSEGSPILTRRPHPSTTSIWVGALVTTKDEGIVDCVEAAYAVPPELFDPWKQGFYENAVEFATSWSMRLTGALAAYFGYLTHPVSNGEHPAEKLSTKEREHVREIGTKAAADYWTSLDQQRVHLFTVARELTAPEQLPDSPWGKAVAAAAREAYERTCPHRTPRQIQAFVLGQRFLFPAAKSQTPAAKSPKSRKPAL